MCVLKGPLTANGEVGNAVACSTPALFPRDV